MLNRDLSWLEFNARVLAGALDRNSPLLERLRFLAIVSTNFDEFFMVRVAALKSRIRSGDAMRDQSGLGAREILSRVRARTREMVAAQYACLTDELLPGLAAAGVEIVPAAGWTAQERRFLDRHFSEGVFPVITPLRVETGDAPGTGNAVPPIGNLRMHVAFELADESGAVQVAVAQVPPNLRRFVRISEERGARQADGLARFALLEDVVASFGARFFPGYAVKRTVTFKVARDADTGVDEGRDDDFLAAMEEVIAGRQDSTPVRMTWRGESPKLANTIRTALGLDTGDSYRLPGPVDLRGFLELVESETIGGSWSGSARLRDAPWPPVHTPPREGVSIWQEIEERDLFLQLPYQAYDPVIRFLDSAADDPSVLAIKMTLYRTSAESPILKALARAASAGKQVAVVVELKARFDEERNIGWASRLERSGAIVTYGVARLKVHAKAAMVIRRAEDGQIRRYVHLSTGNYNDRTARLYSDLSVFTANEGLCREVSIFFNMLTGYSNVQMLGQIAIAPFDLKTRLIGLIEREAQRSTPESPGLIMAKLNSLADPEVVEALYAASQAGVRIRLNVRGICTLIPGVPGLSENIEVHSLLGRYLEHSRIAYFRNGGSEELYLSSADWLPRNLERRIELMFPVLDESIKQQARVILESCFADTRQSHRLTADGSWQPITLEKGERPYSAQEAAWRRVRAIAKLAEAPQEELQVRR